MKCNEITRVLVIADILHSQRRQSVDAACMLRADNWLDWKSWIISMCEEYEFVFTCALLFVS